MWNFFSVVLFIYLFLSLSLSPFLSGHRDCRFLSFLLNDISISVPLKFPRKARWEVQSKAHCASHNDQPCILNILQNSIIMRTKNLWCSIKVPRYCRAKFVISFFCGELEWRFFFSPFFLKMAHKWLEERNVVKAPVIHPWIFNRDNAGAKHLAGNGANSKSRKWRMNHVRIVNLIHVTIPIPCDDFVFSKPKNCFSIQNQKYLHLVFIQLNKKVSLASLLNISIVFPPIEPITHSSNCKICRLSYY